LKTILKLAVAAAVLNAVYQGAQATREYFALKDGAHEVITLGGETPTSELHDRILARAAELELPLQPENLVVDRVDKRTTATGHYTQEVEFLPTVRVPLDLSFTVESLFIRPPTLKDVQ
jgi:hypothetical protein